MKKDVESAFDLQSLDISKRKKENKQPRPMAKSKMERGPGRYWGIVILLLTIIASLLFRFFS